MKTIYDNCYCKKLEQHIKITKCKKCKYNVFEEFKRIYCNYPNNK